MPDQATDLRALVRKVATPQPSVAAKPRRILVFGGKGGLGTTTIAMNLAVDLAQQGLRSLLCDAAGGDIAQKYRLEPRYTLADALAGRRMVSQALHPGPAGVQILPGGRELVNWQEIAERDWSRLMTQVAGLSPRPEVLVIDAGSRTDPLSRHLWQTTDRILLVATVETAAIMEAYAAIKLLTDPLRSASIALIVNRAPNESAADEAQLRLAKACRRFLGLPLRNVGYLPEDSAIQQCTARGEPFVLAMSDCTASRQLRQIARALTNQTSSRIPAAA
jgi:flagellar biosynthesis protein FlhG